MWHVLGNIRTARWYIYESVWALCSGGGITAWLPHVSLCLTLTSCSASIQYTDCLLVNFAFVQCASNQRYMVMLEVMSFPKILLLVLDQQNEAQTIENVSLEQEVFIVKCYSIFAFYCKLSPMRTIQSRELPHCLKAVICQSVHRLGKHRILPR